MVAVAPAAGTGAASSRGSVPPRSPGRVVTVARRAGEAGRDTGCRRPGRPDDLEALRLGPLFLAREHGHDGDALDLELGVDPQHVARFGSLGEQVAVKHAPGLEGPSGPPGPAAIRPRASQLDVNPAGHALNLPGFAIAEASG
jgi:hypothetical protein